VTHEELLAEVLELAAARGVAWIFANGTRSTPGATDLVLVGDGRVAFAEIKSEDGRCTRPQLAFADRVSSCGVSCYLWRPAHLENGTIDQVLTWLGS
jgi:hypothetical protein